MSSSAVPRCSSSTRAQLIIISVLSTDSSLVAHATTPPFVCLEFFFASFDFFDSPSRNLSRI